LTTLTAEDDGIVDLTGLQYATNLQSLDLRGNRIQDIGALSALTNLSTLNLSDNRISDISALSGMTHLSTLWLMDNFLDTTPGSATMAIISTLQGRGASVDYSGQDAPYAPYNTSPQNGSTGVGLTPTLTASVMSDPDGTGQAAAEWIVTRASNGSTAFDTGTDTSDLNSYLLPPGHLAYGTMYSWQVRYENNGGLWSAWSTATDFTTTTAIAPTITSANHTSFTVGEFSTFTMNATGFPPVNAFRESGNLPTGITFNPQTGTLSGTPAPGTGGIYALTLFAGNGALAPATQSFALTVDVPVAFTSATSAIFIIGKAITFTVLTNGFPLVTLSESGALPKGVTFVNNGNDTATLGGTPTGPANVYTLKFTAGNGVGGAASQSFTLMVAQPAAITSANHATFTTGKPGTFTMTTSGFPSASILPELGNLPTGLTFNSQTGTLSGTPASGTGGIYNLTLGAGNGVGDPASQSFTLTVDAAPAFTSAAEATLSIGTAGTFTITTSGFPLATLTELGALPQGITFSDNGNGTAIFSGTPTETAKAYILQITANNGVLANVMQTLTLTIR
jgi:hypothetical protein